MMTSSWTSAAGVEDIGPPAVEPVVVVGADAGPATLLPGEPVETHLTARDDHRLASWTLSLLAADGTHWLVAEGAVEGCSSELQETVPWDVPPGLPTGHTLTQVGSTQCMHSRRTGMSP